jgi:hypothetical protein
MSTKDVEVRRQVGLPAEVVGVPSYDEKPGIQAIANTAPDLPAVPVLRACPYYPAMARTQLFWNGPISAPTDAADRKGLASKRNGRRSVKRIREKYGCAGFRMRLDSNTEGTRSTAERPLRIHPSPMRRESDCSSGIGVCQLFPSSTAFQGQPVPGSHSV